MSFLGSHDHSLDDKGRVSIPAGFRVEIQRLSGERTPVLSPGPDHLILYPAEIWEEVEQKLASKSSLLPDVQRLKRYVFGGSSPCPIDGQGRITIPAKARELAKLETKVTLLGSYDRIEIWNNDHVDAAQQSTREDYDQIQISVNDSDSGS